jgi:glycosyltransferase involved in cell wall biosynthesis
LDLSVVIPVYNERDNIAPLVAEIGAALDGKLDYEIVYVDDGSDDGTARRIGELRRDRPRLRLVRHLGRAGQSAAIRSGVKAARAAWIATLDGDGQNDPADIPALWAMAASRPQAAPPRLLVAGQRTRRRDSRMKRVSSRIANGVRGRLLGDRTPDTGCGLKLFPRELYLDLPFFDHGHRFLPALVLREGGAVISVAVNHRPRQRGRSKYGTFDRLWIGIVDLCGVAWLQRRRPRAIIATESQPP